MKKILPICAVVIAALFLITSCTSDKSCTEHSDDNGDGICDVCGDACKEDCTSHTDANYDGKCDTCGKDVKPPTVMVNYSAILTDQDNTPVANAEITVFYGTDEVCKVTTDGEGKFSGTLAEGQYVLSFTSLPDGIFPYDEITYMVISAAQPNVTVIVENTIPDGSEQRPFPISVENPSVTLSANTGFFFSIGGGARILKITDPDIEIVYGETVYTPDENGNIEIKLVPENHFTPIVLKISNTSDNEKTFGFTFESIPGSPERPFDALLDTSYTASVDKEGTVYYKWISDKNGILCITSITEHNTVMLYNKTTMEVSPYTDGKACEYVRVNVGDEISIAIASTSKEAVSEVIFSLSCTDGSSSDPISVLDEKVSFSIAAGEQLSFVSDLPEADTVTFKNSAFTVSVNGNEIEPDDNGKTVCSFKKGDVITVKNVSDERADINLTFSSSSEQ